MRTSSSDKATFFNLVNNYVGMVLLSMHYCFAQSGWLALLALAALTGFGAFTGDCLVTSYRLIEADNPARAPSYAEIGGRCLGPAGKWLVVVSSLLENFFAILCMIIIIWANTQLLLPDMDPNWVVGLCVAFSFPTNWLKDFSLLSFLSAFGLGCVLLIIAVVTFDAGDALLDPATPSAKTTLADVSGLPMSGSIMLAGLTGHVGLPPMYTEMKTPSHFRRVLYLAFLAMFLMYAAVGVGGYALYGDGASILITQDMANAAGANDGLGQVFRYLERDASRSSYSPARRSVSWCSSTLCRMCMSREGMCFQSERPTDGDLGSGVAPLSVLLCCCRTCSTRLHLLGSTRCSSR